MTGKENGLACDRVWVGHWRKVIPEARKSSLESQIVDPDPHLSEPLSSRSPKEKASETL